MEIEPEVPKLLFYGSKITNSVEKNLEIFLELQTINSNNIKTLKIYGNYLKDIVNDEIEGAKLLDKSDYIQKYSKEKKLLIR